MKKKPAQETLGNRMLEQLILNTMNPLKGQKALEDAEARRKTNIPENTVTIVNEDNKEKTDMSKSKTKAPITEQDMNTNAAAAAARGAALLDKRMPGWAQKTTLKTFVSDTDKNDPGPDFLSQLDIVPGLLKKDGDALNRFAALQEGEERFVSQFKGLPDQERAAAMFVGMLLGVPMARQERSPKQEQGQIDWAYYGFSTEYAVIGLGQRGGYPVTPAETEREGFCIEKAGRALAAAWQRELDKRRQQ